MKDQAHIAKQQSVLHPKAVSVGRGREQVVASMEAVEQPAGESGWRGRLLRKVLENFDIWSYSPFAFASPTLDQQFQVYHSAHVGKHAMMACAAGMVYWISVSFQAVWEGQGRGAWTYALPILTSTAIILLITRAPQVYQRHWQLCAGLYQISSMIASIEIRRAAVEMYASRTVPLMPSKFSALEYMLLTVTPLLVLGAPINLPLWAIIQVAHLIFWCPSAQSYCQVIGGPAGRGLSGNLLRLLRFNAQLAHVTSPHVPSPGLSAVGLASCVNGTAGGVAAVKILAGASASFVETTQLPPELACKVRILFWDIQAMVGRAVGGLLRDVWWRRQFLRTHTHLIGPDGGARAALWPFGASHMILSALGVAIGLIMWDVQMVDVMLAVVLRGLNPPIT